MNLHLAYQETDELRRLLDGWDLGVADEGPVIRHRWTEFAVWPAARSATVAASTGIEGNPLSVEQVHDVLSGTSVEAAPGDIRDVRNYNAALDLANRAALRRGFRWSQELLRRLNAEVIQGLEDDERGEYRQVEVVVGGAFRPPEPARLPGLMEDLEAWLQEGAGGHTLIDAGLTHLNVVSIHPWLNGNGRTARVAGSLMLMRRGVAAPELVNVESWIRAHPEEYVDALQASHGPDYRPDRRAATPFLEYFARISVDRLELRHRIDAAIRLDLGLLTLELSRERAPMEAAPILLAASLGPIRTSILAGRLGLSAPRVRAILAQLVRDHWLAAEGDRRGRRYVQGRRLARLDLRLPPLMDRLRRGAPIED
jgi:Fic family protein